MATSIYINNNPGNIKYFQSGGKEGVDYYVGSSGIKYRKYDSKAKGLAGEPVLSSNVQVPVSAP